MTVEVDRLTGRGRRVGSSRGPTLSEWWHVSERIFGVSQLELNKETLFSKYQTSPLGVIEDNQLQARSFLKIHFKRNKAGQTRSPQSIRTDNDGSKRQRPLEDSGRTSWKMRPLELSAEND